MAKSEAGNSDQLLDENDRWSNCDDWNDEEDVDCRCPFCDEILRSVPDTFLHCSQIHSFDFGYIKKHMQLDFYGCMRLVNFVRNSKPTQQEVLSETSWNVGDENLVPVLPDDPLLYAFEDDESEEESEVLTTGRDFERELLQKERECAELREQLNSYKAQFESYKEMVQKTFMSDTVKNAVHEMKEEVFPLPSKSIYHDKGNYYYDSYAGNEIHEQMLKDTVRTEGYRDFMYNNKGFLKDKIVLDVGCGTGILSMFAAKAGAKHVYAVDNSDVIEKAKANAEENGLKNQITFVRGKVEDIQLPVSQVDIIVSEWMGYFLLFEGMLDSVLVARDKWLKSTGIMAPSTTKILLSAYGDDEWYNDHILFWKDVYGFQMNAMAKNITRNAFVTVANGDAVISNDVVLFDIDTKTITSKALDFTSEFEISITKAGKVYAFCGWFDTFFEGQEIDTVMFSTSPKSKTTHWVQTLFVLNDPITVELDDSIVGSFSCKKSAENPRELDVEILYGLKGSVQRHQQQFFVV
jgi:protein arginine N-methyltransferase 3